VLGDEKRCLYSGKDRSVKDIMRMNAAAAAAAAAADDDDAGVASVCDCDYFDNDDRRGFQLSVVLSDGDKSQGTRSRCFLFAK